MQDQLFDHSGVEVAAARDHFADGFDELGRRAVLREIPGRAGIHRPACELIRRMHAERSSTGSAGRSRRRSFSRSIPLAPGSERSSTITSHSVLRTSFMPSSAFAASPTSAGWNAPDSTCLMPWRTTRMIVDEKNSGHVLIRDPAPRRYCLYGDRNGHGYRRPPARRAGNRHAAAKQSRALGHAQQPDRLDARELGLRDAAPVVSNRQRQHFSALAHADAHRAGVCVPDDIGHRLLQNAEHRQLPRAIDRFAFQRPRQPASNARARLELCRFPLQSLLSARDDPAPPAEGRSKSGERTECSPRSTRSTTAAC